MYGYFEQLITARKRSLRRLCFYRCLSVHTGGACVVLFRGVHGFIWGVRGFIWGACVVLFWGVCVVLFRGGGHVWFYLGGAWFYLGGHAWFYLGGMHGFIWGGVHDFFSFSGYNEIRSMSRRYASYWNAFLFCLWKYSLTIID